MRRIVVGIVCALLGLSASAFAQLSVPLSIAQGALAGTQDDGIDVFKNIPFAAPPVGPLRWRATQPGPSWQGVRPADSFGPICPQPRYGTQGALPQSEDCLSLNVWTPDTHAKLPVMVWIYGGAFVTGGSAILYTMAAPGPPRRGGGELRLLRVGWASSIIRRSP